MAPTSDERREVARKLREEGKIWDSTNPDPEWYYNRIDRCLGHHGLTFEGLADLIDPCPSMADEQMGKLRRRSTALASITRIASDMSGWAGELADSCERMSRARIADDVRRFADRIRQEARDALN